MLPRLREVVLCRELIWQYERELDPGPNFYRGLNFAFGVVDAGRFVIFCCGDERLASNVGQYLGLPTQRLLTDPSLKRVTEIMRSEFKICRLFSRHIETHGTPFVSCCQR